MCTMVAKNADAVTPAGLPGELSRHLPEPFIMSDLIEFNANTFAASIMDRTILISRVKYKPTAMLPHNPPSF